MHPKHLDTRLGVIVTLFLALTAILYVVNGYLPASSNAVPTQQLVIVSAALPLRLLRRAAIRSSTLAAAAVPCCSELPAMSSKAVTCRRLTLLYPRPFRFLTPSLIGFMSITTYKHPPTHPPT